jgi:hypothetical protein
MSHATDSADETAVDSPSDDPADTQTEVETLADIRPEFECYVKEEVSVPASRSLSIDRRGNVSKPRSFSQPHWDDLTLDQFYCYGCHEEFETEAEARKHLKRKKRRWEKKYGLPDVPRQADPDASTPQFIDDTKDYELQGLSIELKPTATNAMGLVESGLPFLRSAHRRTISLPEDLSFDHWGALQEGGALLYPNGNPRINTSLLKKAIQYFSTMDGSSYNPDHLVLYDYGDKPFVLAHHGEAIAIAPLKDGSNPSN